jgi:predicted Rossmann-fold nucleotide-binding protein
MKRSLWRILALTLVAELGLICGVLVIKGGPPSVMQALIWGAIALTAVSAGTIARSRRRSS